MTITKTFREDPQRAAQETYDLWDIWSEWWGNMTRPIKRQCQRQRQRQWQRPWQRHWEKTLKEQPKRPVTFETFDAETWPVQQKYNDNDNDNDKDNVKDILRTPIKDYPIDLWPLRHFTWLMRRHDITNTDNDNDIQRTPWKSNPRDLLPLRHWLNIWPLRAIMSTFIVTLD